MKLETLKKGQTIIAKKDLFRIDGHYFPKDMMFTIISNDIEIQTTKQAEDKYGRTIRICNQSIKNFKYA